MKTGNLKNYIILTSVLLINTLFTTCAYCASQNTYLTELSTKPGNIQTDPSVVVIKKYNSQNSQIIENYYRLNLSQEGSTTQYLTKDQNNIYQIATSIPTTDYLSIKYNESDVYYNVLPKRDLIDITDVIYVNQTNSNNSIDSLIYNEGNINTISGQFIGNAAAHGSILRNATHSGYTISGVVNEISGIFVGNHAYGSSDGKADGGVIANRSRHSDEKTDVEKTLIKSINGTFIGNYAKAEEDSNKLGYVSKGGAISNGNLYSNGNGIITEIKGDFVNNFVYSKDSTENSESSGGAIYNTINSIIDTIEANFTNNYAESFKSSTGGAISNGSGTDETLSSDSSGIKTIKGDFVDNHTLNNGNTGYSYGGAIYSTSYIGNIEGNFAKNYAQGGSAIGGAIVNANGTATIESITGDFTENHVITNLSAPVSGGAIWTHNGATEQNKTTQTSNGTYNYTDTYIGKINGDFTGNFAQSSKGYATGGAISSKGPGRIKEINGNFSDNYVSSISIVNPDATSGGGAIHNLGIIEKINGNFQNNYVASKSNSSTGATVAGGAFGGAIDFRGYYFAEEYLAGYKSNVKITEEEYNTGYNKDIFSNIRYNYYAKDVDGKTYENSSLPYIGSITGNFEKNNVSAEGKYNALGGAIYNTGNEIQKITGSFIENQATTKQGDAIGGAIYNEGYSKSFTVPQKSTISIMSGDTCIKTEEIDTYTDYMTNYVNKSTQNVIYEYNEQTKKGTVYGKSLINITADTNDNKGIVFSSNKAISNQGNSYGGAIYNGKYGTINLTAKNSDIKFSGNIADKGGAIYNANNGEITLKAQTGQTIEFETLNDTIHNEGTLVIGANDYTGNVILQEITDNTTPTGQIVINGANVTANGKITQDILKISSGTLYIDIDNLSITNQIENNGELMLNNNDASKIQTFIDSQTQSIKGNGILTIDTSGELDITNLSNVQSTLKTTGNGHLVLTGKSKINILNQMGGNTLEITDVIEGNLTNDENGHVNFSQNADITGNINNNGILDISTNYTVKSGITGNGTTNIKTNTTTGKTEITQSKINIMENANLSSISSISTTNGISNKGTLELNGATLNSDVSGSGTLSVIQDSTIETGEITNAISIADNKKLTNNGKINTTLNLATNQTIAGNGSLNLNGTSQNSGSISQNSLVNSGTLNNNGTIKATEITNNASATINTNATNIISTNGLINNGNLVLTAGTLKQKVSGTGTITIEGSVGTSATYLENNITNDSNELTLTGGTLAKTISGNGKTIVSGDVVSSASIDNMIKIQNNSSLEINAQNIANSAENSGTLKLEEGTLANKISGNGTIITKGNITSSANYLGNNVTNDHTLTLTGGTLEKTVSGTGTIVTSGNVTSSADYLGNNVTNDHTLTLTGGTLKKTVSGSGTTNIGNNSTTLVSLDNSASITNNISIKENATLSAQAEKFNENASGNITNNGTIQLTGGKLTATLGGHVQIKSDATVDATNKNFSGNLTNLGIYNLSGNLDKNIDGNGKTVLQNDVSVSNGTTISGTLDLNEKKLNMQDSTQTFQTLNIGSLSGSGSIAINADITNNEGKATASDKILITNLNLNNATLKVSSINLTGNTADFTEGSYNDYIDYVTGNTSGITYQLVDNQSTFVSGQDGYSGRIFNFSPGTAGSLNMNVINSDMSLNEFITNSEQRGGLVNTYSLNSDSIQSETIGTTAQRNDSSKILSLYLNNGSELSAINNSIDGITVDTGFTFNLTGSTFDNKTASISNFQTALINKKNASLNITDMTFNNNSTDIKNDGIVNFSGTNTLNSINGDGSANNTGTLNISADGLKNSLNNSNILNLGSGTLEKTVSGNGTIITKGNITSSANYLGNNVTNDHTLTLTGGTLEKTVSGNGTIITKGDITSSANYLGNNVTNDHTLTLTGGTLEKTVSGNGTISINGLSTTILEKDITQNYLNISSDFKTTQNTVINNTITLNNGNWENNGTITAKQFHITGGSLTTNANYLNTDIANNSKISFTGGTLNKNITGSGQVLVKENSTFVNNAMINNTISNSGIITNKGQIKGNITGGYLTAEDKSSIIGNISNVKELTVNGNSSIDGNINNTDLNLNSGILALNGSINFKNTFISGGNINLQNNSIDVTDFGNLKLNKNVSVMLDADLANSNIDKLKVTTATGDGKIDIADIKLLSATEAETITTNIFADENTKAELKDKVTGNLTNLVYSPIYKYNANYDPQTGTVVLQKPTSDKFNPAILSSVVSSQAGGYTTLLNSYNLAFADMDIEMSLTEKQRQSAVTNDSLSDNNKNVWVRPYQYIERIPLKNGPNVNNSMYGYTFGVNSAPIPTGENGKTILNVYAGYNGSHQSYDTVSTYQNGGQIGISGIYTAKKFFTGLTATAGLNIIDTDSNYGKENTGSFIGGIASKSGYNFEFNKGKFIVQPNYEMSYSMINTFNYKNAAGVDISSNTLNAFQISPGLKLICNLDNGWQIYGKANYTWNFYDNANFKANNADLPQMSIKPYAQYGLGIEKKWGNCTGYLQATLFTGGRKGISLSEGLRWKVGKKLSKL